MYRPAAPGLVVRLALVNSIGFSSSTVVPLWLGDIGAHLGVSTEYGGLAATLQLVACAGSNLATSVLLRTTDPIRLIRIGLFCACAANALAALANAPLFLISCVCAGASLGAALNATNRVVAGFERVQQAYAVFQVTEVCFAASLFFVASAIAQGYGVGAIFAATAVANALGCCLVGRRELPTAHSQSREIGGISAPWALGVSGLVALMVFFVGQSTVNSFMIPIGRDIGLPTPTISRLLSSGLLSGLLGAFGARVLGERLGTLAPVVAVIVILAAMFPALTAIHSPTLFAMAALLLPSCTIFVVPYFFTSLARFDRLGRYSSVGPAFLLLGVAAGPSVAVHVQSEWGFRAVGPLAAAVLVFGGLIFSGSQWAVRRQHIELSKVTSV